MSCDAVVKRYALYEDWMCIVHIRFYYIYMYTWITWCLCMICMNAWIDANSRPMISRQDFWTDVRIGCSCYWCFQVFFKRDKLRNDKISTISGVAQLRYMFRTGFMSQILSWCEKPGDHYSRWGWFFLPWVWMVWSQDFWMKQTIHWSQLKMQLPSFWGSPFEENDMYEPLVEQHPTCRFCHCDILCFNHVSQKPTSATPPVGLESSCSCDHLHVEGLGLVVGSDHALLWSEWREVEGRPMEWQTVEPKRTPGWF